MVDYVFNWVKAIPSPTNDSRIVAKLFKKVLSPYFGVPRVLISDNGMHFIEKKLKALLKNHGVHYKFKLGYDPQKSGQVEISNCEIKYILEKTVARSRKDWAKT